jgi:hypothetical protein
MSSEFSKARPTGFEKLAVMTPMVRRDFRIFNVPFQKIQNMKKVSKKDEDNSPESKKFPLPIYSEDEDIYKKEKEVGLDEDEEPELNKIKGKIKKEGDDLDVPGSELDDADELIGEEDEENNYYSLGGDDHEDLEEDNEDNR